MSKKNKPNHDKAALPNAKHSQQRLARRRLGGHSKIGRACRENRGVWLTPEDVEDLWNDQAIKDAVTGDGRGFEPSPIESRSTSSAPTADNRTNS